MSPDGKTKSLQRSIEIAIDHLHIDNRYKSSVRQFRNFRVADGDKDLQLPKKNWPIFLNF